MQTSEILSLFCLPPFCEGRIKLFNIGVEVLKSNFVVRRLDAAEALNRKTILSQSSCLIKHEGGDATGEIDSGWGNAEDPLIL